MPLVRKTVKNIVAGISQQAEILRFEEQLADQVNAISNSSNGLCKRPPTLHVATLPTDLIDPMRPPLIQTINRSETEKYTFMFNGYGVHIMDHLGNVKPVNRKVPFSYMDTTTPRTDIKIVTVADYTFVTNIKKPTRMATDITSNVWESQGALVHVRSGQYARNYIVIVNNTIIANHQTPDGSNAGHTPMIDTNYIVGELVKKMEAGGAQIWMTGEGWIYFTMKNGAKITTLETRDGSNNQAFKGFLKVANHFTDLPATAPNSFTILIRGDKVSRSDDYYTAFNTSTGTWKECARPQILSSFDKDTMPHVLRREADGSFTFDTIPWGVRDVGDDDSNSLPSFVGKPIKELSFVRNRLVFLAGENIIMSKSGDFFKFWMTTATDVLDSDTIDYAVPDETIVELEHAVPFNEGILLFSSSAQFLGRSDNIFSPKSFRVDKVTSFDCTPMCKPIVAGNRIYFSNDHEEFSSLMEYYVVADNSGIKNAQDITSHVPELLTNTIHKVIASTSENVILLLSSGKPNRIYVYKYLWQQEQRVLASWSYWDFGKSEVLGGGFSGSELTLCLRRGESTILEKIVFTSANTKDFPVCEPYRAFLDRKGIQTIKNDAYNDLTDETTLNMQEVYLSALPEDSTYGLVAKDGYFATCTDKDPIIRLIGDYRGQTVVVGELFNFKATLSQLMIKTPDGKGGIISKTNGTLQVRSLDINYEDSGLFSVSVAHEGKDTYVTDMTARFLGSVKNKVGALPLATGSLKVPVQGDSREVTISIESNSPSPLSIIGYNWEANHVERSNR